jgi:hypothetical protein
MQPSEIAEVERLVNSWVAAASPTSIAEMELDAARAAGATAMFGEKYDDVVRVVEVPGVSMELCGGECVCVCVGGGGVESSISRSEIFLSSSIVSCGRGEGVCLYNNNDPSVAAASNIPSSVAVSQQR